MEKVRENEIINAEIAIGELYRVINALKGDVKIRMFCRNLETSILQSDTICDTIIDFSELNVTVSV
jgi:hypothetical protein